MWYNGVWYLWYCELNDFGELWCVCLIVNLSVNNLDGKFWKFGVDGFG